MMKKGLATLSLCLVLVVSVFLLNITLIPSRSPMIYSTSTQGEKYSKGYSRNLKARKPITCDRSHNEYDLCNLNHPSVLDPTTATLSAADPTTSTPPLVEKIRPYPRKWQNHVMSLIKELTLTTAPPNTPCTVTHNIPALVFSAGGYTGNFLHDFNDGFIPLFITINSLFPHQDFILVIVNCHDWWLSKYADLLRHFTQQPIINLDHEKTTHCFPSAIVGLISHGPMTVDPTLLPGPHPKTILDFHTLLATTYSQGHAPPSQQLKARPQLVLMRRKGNRRILNEDNVRQVIEEVGFDVVVFEPTHQSHLHKAFRLIHNSHAVIGVHGAALTHELFLQPGSVVMQVVPIGFNWLADICFGKLAGQLGMDYTEYDIEVQESSLVDKYARDSLELNNPGAIVNGTWSNMGIYLNQDVKLDLVRFRRYLKVAYEKAKRFMLKESLHIEH